MKEFEGVKLNQIYREHLLDHYNNPRNNGVLEGAAHFHDVNPLCGDEIDLYAILDEDKIKEITFTGKGCAISQASASMLTEFAQGKNVNELLKMDSDAMQELVGIKISAARVKCMMLSLKALKRIIYGGQNVRN